MATIEPVILARWQTGVPEPVTTVDTDVSAATPSEATAGGTATIAGLPLPTIQRSTQPAPANYYVVSSIDARGRVADRSALRALRWPPGTRIKLSAANSRVVATLDPDSCEAITVQGHLRLAARIRHALRLSARDRLLIVADLQSNLLTAYTTPAVDAILIAAAVTPRRPK